MSSSRSISDTVCQCIESEEESADVVGRCKGFEMGNSGAAMPDRVCSATQAEAYFRPSGRYDPRDGASGVLGWEGLSGIVIFPTGEEGVWVPHWPDDTKQHPTRGGLARLIAVLVVESKTPHSKGEETPCEDLFMGESDFLAGRAPSDCGTRCRVSSIRAELEGIMSGCPMLDGVTRGETCTGETL